MNQKIEFCCGGKKCPIIEKSSENTFLIGGNEEGITTFDKDQMRDFVNAAKSGKFDEIIK